jgi:hypothetical protein
MRGYKHPTPVTTDVAGPADSAMDGVPPLRDTSVIPSAMTASVSIYGYGASGGPNLR